MKEKTNTISIKKLLATILLTSTVKTFNTVYNVLQSDIVSVPVETLFNNKNRREKPDQPQNIFTFTVNSTNARIAETREINSGMLKNGNCKTSKFIADDTIMAACGKNLDAYKIKDQNVSYESTFGGENSGDIQDFNVVKSTTAYTSFNDEDTIRVDFALGTPTKDFVTFDQKSLEKKFKTLNIEISQVGEFDKVLIFEKQSQNENSMILYGDLKAKAIKTLDLADQFTPKLSGIFSIQSTADSNLLISYRSSEAAKHVTATCKIAWEDDLKLSDCKEIPAAKGFDSQHTIFSGSNAFFVTGDNREVYRCKVVNGEFVDCLGTEAKIFLEEGMQLHSINQEKSGSDSANVVFSSNKGFSFVFNFRVKNKKLAFDQVDSNSAITFASNGINGLVVTDKTYSLYSTNKNNVVVPYLTFGGNDFPEGKVDFEIVNNDGVNPKVTRVFTFNILTDSTKDSGIMALPNFKGFNDTNLKQLGIERSLVYGNNLKFSVEKRPKESMNEDTFSILNFNQVNYDVSALGNTFWFTCGEHGIAQKDNTLYRFDCSKDPHGGSGIKCNLNLPVSYPLPAGETVIYVTSNELAEEDGIVVVTSGTSTSTIFHFGIKTPEVFNYQFKEMSIKSGNVYFKVTGKLFTFWIMEENKIKLWSVYDKEFQAIPHEPYGEINVNNVWGSDNFCPKSVQKSPLTPIIVDVLSSCNEGDNRIFTFYTNNVTNIKLLNSRPLTYSQFSKGSYQTCSFGDEILVYNPSSKELYVSTSTAGVSYSNIDSSKYFTSIEGISCVRNSESALVLGKDSKGNKIMGVVYGNRGLAQSNRIHTVAQYQGDIQRAVKAGNGVFITVNNGGSFIFFMTYLNGPFVLFNNRDFKEGEETYSLVISNQQGEKGRGNFNISTVAFNSTVTISKKSDKSQKLEKGTFILDDLSTISGPVFQYNLSSTDKASLSNRLQIDPTYIKQINGSLNVEEPDQFYYGNKIGVGLRMTNMSLIASYFHNYDQFWYVEDVGFYCTAYDVYIQNDEYAIYALATSEGGEYHLRYGVKNFNQKGLKTDGIAIRDINGDRVSIAPISDNKFMVAVVDDRIQTANIFLFSVEKNQDGDYVFTKAESLDPVEDGKSNLINLF